MLRTSALESRGPGKVLQQDFSCGFVFRTNEAQPQQKTAERIFLVVDGLFSGVDPLLVSCHFAQFADEGVIGFPPGWALPETKGRKPSCP